MDTNVLYAEMLDDPTVWKIFEDRYKLKRAEEREEYLYYAKQKATGFVMFALGLVIPFIIDGDITASVLLIPVGLFFLFTKEKILEYKGK